MKDTTIAAISTAQGEGGIGIIRISGEDAQTVADRVFVAQSGKKLCDQKGYTAAYGKIYEDGEVLDEAVAVNYKAPYSYTGENVVELCCHGGLYITRQVLRQVLASGAQLAEPGEFTKRAFLNGKMDLCEAQAVMDIISAQSKQAARTAMSLRTGALSKRIEGAKLQLISLASHLSAWADFPEEDIPEVEIDSVTSVINSVSQELQSLLATYDTGRAILKGIDTAIVGRPNVGKSTLMNLLAGFEKSIVTDIPGTTRDIVEEAVIVGGITLRLSDTAGIRYTDNIIEKIGVDKAREKLTASSLVLAVFDGSTALSEEDKELIDSLADVPTVAIVNKTDLETVTDTDYIKSKLEHTVFVSAKQGSGKDELEEAIKDICGAENFDPSCGILADERQRQSAEASLCALREALSAINVGYSLDAVTVCIEEAIESLLILTGENVSEAVVDDVFHRFCLGK